MTLEQKKIWSRSAEFPWKWCEAPPLRGRGQYQVLWNDPGASKSLVHISGPSAEFPWKWCEAPPWRGRGQYQVQGRAGQHKQLLLLLLQYFMEGTWLLLIFVKVYSPLGGKSTVKTLGGSERLDHLCEDEKTWTQNQQFSLFVFWLQYWIQVKGGPEIHVQRQVNSNQSTIHEKGKCTTLTIEIELIGHLANQDAIQRQNHQKTCMQGMNSILWVEFCPGGVHSRSGRTAAAAEAWWTSSTLKIGNRSKSDKCQENLNIFLYIGRIASQQTLYKKQARKLQATLEGCNPKLSLTVLLAHRGKV